MATKASTTAADKLQAKNLKSVSQPKSMREELGMSVEEFTAMGEMGAMFYMQGNTEKAQIIFEGMLELDPENDAVLSALGAVLTTTRQDEQALVHLNKAIEMNGTEIASFVNRGEIYLRKYEFESAIADLSRAIDLDPLEADPGANRARAMVLGIHQMIESQKAQEKAKNN